MPIQFSRMLWSMVSNAATGLSNTNRDIQPRSDDKSKSFVTQMRTVSVLWYGLNPDWKSSHKPFLSKKENRSEDTSIFHKKGRFEIGL